MRDEMRDEMGGDERRRGGGEEEGRSWDAFKTRTHTSESGGNNFDENINPIPKSKKSNPNRIRRPYTKFEPES